MICFFNAGVLFSSQITSPLRKQKAFRLIRIGRLILSVLTLQNGNSFGKNPTGQILCSLFILSDNCIQKLPMQFGRFLLFMKTAPIQAFFA